MLMKRTVSLYTFCWLWDYGEHAIQSIQGSGDRLARASDQAKLQRDRCHVCAVGTATAPVATAHLSFCDLSHCAVDIICSKSLDDRTIGIVNNAQAHRSRWIEASYPPLQKQKDVC